MELDWHTALNWALTFVLHASCSCVIVPASLWSRPKAESAADRIASL
ncbi:MAG: hypothetical protein HYZ75_01275 [Elusimicrobia bacterium]|nr:hypothetical protein [Elusimicrobiota bacterium]